MLTGLLSLFNDSVFERWSSSRNRVSLWHSHNHTTITSATASLFTHGDWEHVFSNMFLLWMVGRHLFVSENVDKSHRQRRSNHRRAWAAPFSWTSPLAFLWIYLGSQFLAAVGCRLICHCMDREWSRMVANDRELWSWQWVPHSWRDTWFTLSHAKQVVDLRTWQFSPIIGSSAAVYGIVGAHLYAALYCKNHPAELDVRSKAIWLFKIGMEVANTPFTLAQLSMRERGQSNIDHASHFCGLWGGFCLAFVWNRVYNAIRSRKDNIGVQGTRH